MSDAEESTLIFAIETIAMINRSYQNKHLWTNLQINKQILKQNPAVIFGIPKNTLKLPAIILINDPFKFYVSD